MENTYFVFREARSVEELRSLFKLRYRVFREAFLPFVSKNEYQIDLDGYDLRSCHFGLFRNDQSPVGYLRVVDGRPSPLREQITELAERYPGMFQKINEPIEQPFPLMTYFPDADVIVERMSEEIKSRGELAVEASRLSVESAFRSAGLAKHIALSAMAFGFCCKQVHHALIACSPLHSRMYERLGFKQVRGTLQRIVLGIPAVLLIGSYDTVPYPLREQMTRMGNAFRQSGQICYHPSNPENFYAPAKRIVMPQPALRAAA